MHYIRFLKPPQISTGVLGAKLTITSDLGDDFLAADLPLNLIFQHSATGTIIGDPKIVQWKAGNRELVISLPLPEHTKAGFPKDRDSGLGWQLLVWPCLTGAEVEEERVSRLGKWNKKIKPMPTRACARAPKVPSPSAMDYLLNMSDILAINRGNSNQYKDVKGVVLAAKSAVFSLEPGKTEQKLPACVERVFGMGGWDDEGGLGFRLRIGIEEETGESIARHVWDAGVVFSALLREMCTLPDAKKSSNTYLPELYTRLQGGQGEEDDGDTEDGEDDDICTEYAKALNVLELGTGCAIVSATLSQCLPYARIVATDMPEASEIAARNLSRNRTEEIGSRDLEQVSEFEVLDWTMPLSGKKGINSRRWDLVLVADCTYNADVVPALVVTLGALVDRSPDVLVAVALKWRHESEAIFHELMKENGMRQVDKHTERCGNFDEDATGKEEEIEIYLFKGGDAKGGVSKEGNKWKGEKNESERKRKLSDGKEEGLAKK